MTRTAIATLFLIGCASNTLDGGSGTSCTTDANCLNHRCVPLTPDGKLCTTPCASGADCPPNWTCEQLPTGDQICVPPSGKAPVRVPIPAGELGKVDLLFVVDNSPSMSPKQEELKARFPQFLQTIQSLQATHPASYHIGVITSDLGAGPSSIGGACHPDGDRGALQPTANPGDVLAPAACATFQLGGNVNFIDFDQTQLDASGQPTSNLPSGFDLANAFTCLASVGSAGCGLEHPLESAFRALHDPPPENTGFLRADALLAVVFVTDEDDCSAPPDTDLFSLTMTTQLGPLLSYRCTQFGIACDAPGGGKALMPAADSGGPLAGCVPATMAMGGKLFDVDRYIELFTRAAAIGGIKSDPANVVLASFSAPESPVSSILARIGASAPVSPYQTCAGPPDGMTCAVTLQHSCLAATAPSKLFGDPAVRIRAVVNAAHGANTSVCDEDYSSGLTALGQRIAAGKIGGCLPAPIASPAACAVADVADDGSGQMEIAFCGTSTTKPCWRLDAAAGCPGAQRIVIDRGGSAPPPGTHAEALCPGA